MFPVVYRSNVHFGFEHSLFEGPKCRAPRKKFVHSCPCIHHNVRVVNIDKNEIKEKTFPANIYLYRVNHWNTWKSCEICSKLTTKTLELRHWRHSGVFTLNLEHISHPFSSVSVVDFEQVNVWWVGS